MEQNIFEELHKKKQKMTAILSKAEEFGWINENEKKEYLSKIENDVLTIGVIGQMKAGKSTFLNAFVFEDDILPAATTPMTAALSIITYGPEKKIEAEFYTSEEWDEQKRTASLPLEQYSDDLMKSKIQAAHELVEKSSRLGHTLNDLLGKTQSDTLDNLIDYVGAEGKYVSITKSVTIYYPKEYLKGVNIVDTPGFNDPIVSREERTKSFLKKADVVLLMLYAGRPFDAKDRSILFKNVGECGIGKVLLGINKYDIPYENGETEGEICAYVKNEIAKASRIMGDEQLNDILRDTEPIPLSAEMALLSELSSEKIDNNDSFSHAWKRACDTFEISSQKEMRNRSHIDELVSAVRQVIEKEKDVILFKKPLNAIIARGNSLKIKCDEKLFCTKNEIDLLQVPDEELDEHESKLAKVTRRLNKKIDNLGEDIDNTLNEIVRRGSEDLEDAVDSASNKMMRIIDSWKQLTKDEKRKQDIEREEKFLRERTLARLSKDIINKAKNKVKRSLDDFFAEADDLLLKLPAIKDSDQRFFDQRDFVKSVSNRCDFDNVVASATKDSSEGSNDDLNLFEIAAIIVGMLPVGIAYGLTNGLTGGRIWHELSKDDAREMVDNMRFSFDATPLMNPIIKGKDKVISEVKKAFIDELLTPLQTQLDNIRQEGTNKEQRLAEAKDRLITLETRKSELVANMGKIQELTGN